MRLFFLVFILFFYYSGFTQSSQRFVKVHFHYGSKPAKGYEQKEKKRFGGIMGGHVSLEINERIFGFAPHGSFHIFPHRQDKHSFFHNTAKNKWVSDTIDEQYVSILIPLSENQYQALLKIKSAYLSSPPYDYSFFGYRCTASTYEILASIGITKRYGNYRTVKKYFYPKELRTYLVKEAVRNNYTVYFHPGKNSRKWEKDKKKIKQMIDRLAKKDV